MTIFNNTYVIIGIESNPFLGNRNLAINIGLIISYYYKCILTIRVSPLKYFLVNPPHLFVPYMLTVWMYRHRSSNATNY